MASRSPHSLPRRLALAATLLAAVLAAGTLGYALIERWSPLDAFYTTVVVVSTVGMGLHQPGIATAGGKVLTICLVAGGLVAAAGIAGGVARALIEGGLQEALGRRRMNRRIEGLSGHYVICGAGRIGQTVAEELISRGVPFVILERSEEARLRAEELGFLTVLGDATEDHALRAAGVGRARGLVAVVTEDADNLYITLSARQLNPQLFIIARGESPDSEAKLRRAGADRAVSPFRIGGNLIVNAILRPSVLEFIESTTGAVGDFQMEEVAVAQGSPLAGRSLSELGLRDARVVGVRRAGGRIEFAPGGAVRVAAGDVLIAVGRDEEIRALSRQGAGS